MQFINVRVGAHHIKASLSTVWRVLYQQLIAPIFDRNKLWPLKLSSNDLFPSNGFWDRNMVQLNFRRIVLCSDETCFTHVCQWSKQSYLGWLKYPCCRIHLHAQLFLWGNLQSSVHKTFAEAISQIFHWLRESRNRQCNLCIEANGQHEKSLLFK